MDATDIYNQIYRDFRTLQELRPDLCLHTFKNELEKVMIERAIDSCDGIKNRACKVLRIQRTSLVEKCRKHKLMLNPSAAELSRL
jgi:transcriptional regulator with PAS, ATPase and Fis domain